jgi:hypothetical protein
MVLDVTATIFGDDLELKREMAFRANQPEVLTI